MSKLKIKVISRNPDDYLRATKRDIHKREFNVSMTFIIISSLANIITITFMYPMGAYDFCCVLAMLLS